MNPKVIVTLTSYPYRFKKPEMITCLESLINQETDIPYKIIFNIFEGDIKEMPIELVSYVEKNGIEIYRCPLDLRSHKKYYYVMQDYKNLPIITVDDDIVYSKHLVNDLYSSYMKYSKCVSACYLYRMTFDTNDRLICSFKRWNTKYDNYEPSFRNSFGSGGGTLFPPGCLDISEKRMPMIKEYITDDELLLKKWLIDAGVPVVKCRYDWEDEEHGKISKCGSYLEATSYATDNNSLWRSENKFNMNTHIKNLLSGYDYKKLDTSIKPSVIVTMTSWKKRIGNVIKTIESCDKQTRIPDKIYLNLSVEEFPGKEKDIPETIVKYEREHSNFVINWVDGPNTKSFKKAFPILKYCKYNDIIITVDDDMIIPKDFVESRVNDFEKYGQPITSAISVDRLLGCNKINAGSLFTKKMLWNWDRVLTDKMIETCNDDRTYLYILYLNGYIPRLASTYDIRDIFKYMLNEGTDNKLSSVVSTYKFGRHYDEYVNDVIMKLTGKPIEKSFGYFNNNNSQNSSCVPSFVKSEPVKKINKIQSLRRDIEAGRVVRVPVVGGFVWRRVK